MHGKQRGEGGGEWVGAWGQLGAAGIDWCMKQYFNDSLNFSGCNSHRLSFDIEFRDTSQAFVEPCYCYCRKYKKP